MNLVNSHKVIMFDFEGTLVDFQWKVDEAVREAISTLAMFGFDENIFHRCDYATLFNRAIEESGRLRSASKRVMEKIGEVYDSFDLDAVKRWTPKMMRYMFWEIW